MAVKPIPDGYHTATPYLIVKNASAAIDFYQAAFGATELMRMAGPDGNVGHAEIKVGDSPIMIGVENLGCGCPSPETLGGTPVTLLLYVEDVDAVVARAVAAGATILRPVCDQFYGDRSGKLSDPFGHAWIISTRKEDLTAAEVQHRSEEFMANHECN